MDAGKLNAVVAFTRKQRFLLMVLKMRRLADIFVFWYPLASKNCVSVMRYADNDKKNQMNE